MYISPFSLSQKKKKTCGSPSYFCPSSKMIVLCVVKKKICPFSKTFSDPYPALPSWRVVMESHFINRRKQMLFQSSIVSQLLFILTLATIAVCGDD